MRIVLIIHLFLNVQFFFGQKKFKPIYIDLIKQYYLPTKLMDYDSISMGKNKIFKFYLTNETGEMKFEIILNKNILIKGSYSNSLAVFKRYGESFNSDGSSEMTVNDYYYPLRDGDWIFYDVKTKKSKQKKYYKGLER